MTSLLRREAREGFAPCQKFGHKGVILGDASQNW